MATCAVQPLLDDAACFNALTGGQQSAVGLVLLCQILQALDPVATCDVQDLLDDAACFNILTGGQQSVVGLQLLCEITDLLGASGGCTVFARRHAADFADPNGNVTGCPGDVYVRTSTGALWKKLSGLNTDTGWSV